MAKAKTIQTSATLADGVVLHSQVPMQTELERIFNWTAKRITLKDGTSLADKLNITVKIEERGSRAAACFTRADQAKWATRHGVLIATLSIKAEDLELDGYDIAGRVVHGLVHFKTLLERTKDRNDSGKHRPVFAAAAEHAGLVVEDRGDSKGHAYTSLSDDLRKQLETKLKLKTDVFNMWRLENPPAKKKKSTPKRTVYVCGCDIKASVSAGVMFDAVCNACATTFVPVE